MSKLSAGYRTKLTHLYLLKTVIYGRLDLPSGRITCPTGSGT